MAAWIFPAADGIPFIIFAVAFEVWCASWLTALWATVTNVSCDKHLIDGLIAIAPKAGLQIAIDYSDFHGHFVTVSSHFSAARQFEATSTRVSCR